MCFSLIILAVGLFTPIASSDYPVVVSINPTRTAEYRGAGKVLSAIDCRLDAWGCQQLSGKGYDAATYGHEGVHMLNSSARNNHGGRVNAFYIGDGKCAIIKEPRTTIERVAQFVPEHLRGTRFNTYLVSQRSGWNAQPLYILDEWSAYIADAAVALSQASEGLPFAKHTDAAVGQLEFLPYALAVVCAAEADDPDYMAGPDGEQLRRVVAWGCRKAQEQYNQCQSVDGLKWHCEVCISHPAAAKLRSAMEKCCGKKAVPLPQSMIDRPALPQSTIRAAKEDSHKANPFDRDRITPGTTAQRAAGRNSSLMDTRGTASTTIVVQPTERYGDTNCPTGT